MERSSFGGSSDSFEQSIRIGDEDRVRGSSAGNSASEMRLGFDDETTATRNAYRRAKIVQSAAQTVRHLVRMNPSQLEEGTLEDDEDDNDIIEEQYKFKKLSPEEEPVFKPKTKIRAKKAVKAISKLVNIKQPKVEEPKVKEPKVKKEKISKKEREERKAKQNSKLMSDAANIGKQMAPKLMFPGLSSLMQDLWVYAENGITLYQFISSAQSIKEQHTKLKIVAFVFSSLALILAAIDFFLYFVQLGSCARIVRALIKKFRHENEEIEESGEENKDDSPVEHKRCICISEEWKERLETWFETSRSVLSELLLFPILVLDMFDFITSSPYLLMNGQSDAQGIAFFAVASCFFFVLSVYVMRIFILLSTTAVLTQMPLDICKSQKDTTAFVISFAITAMGQMISQFAVILAVGVKIKHETPIASANDVYVSPFLICLILLGAAIPNFGLLAYFLVNYFEFNDFSVGMFINMMSLLQSESFAETVFGGEGGEKPLEKAEELTEKLNLSKSKQVFDKKRQSPDNKWSAKVLAAMKIPALVLAGVLYYAVIIAFLLCLVLTKDSATGEVQFVLFRYSGLCIAFFLVSVSLLVSNMYSLFMIHVWMLVALLMGLSTLTTFLFTCLWSPFACIASYFGHLVQVAREMDII
ncbi:hypothetical protein EMCRGX_G014946 [Ephydatia muelleri]